MAAAAEGRGHGPLNAEDVQWGVTLLDQALQRMMSRLDEISAVVIRRLGVVGRIPPDDVRGAFSESCQPFVYALTNNCMAMLQTRLRETWLDAQTPPTVMVSSATQNGATMNLEVESEMLVEPVVETGENVAARDDVAGEVDDAVNMENEVVEVRNVEENDGRSRSRSPRGRSSTTSTTVSTTSLP